MEKPEIEVTDRRVLNLVERLNGMSDAEEAVKKLEVNLPGTKLALSAIAVEFQKARIVLHANLFRLSAQAGVSVEKFIVTGLRSDKKKYFLMFTTPEEIDKE